MFPRRRAGLHLLAHHALPLFRRAPPLVRIAVGEEVIRRYCNLPRTASEADLRAAAQTTLRDEGYELDGAAITIEQSKAAGQLAGK
jgi:hypothetical protein